LGSQLGQLALHGVTLGFCRNKRLGGLLSGLQSLGHNARQERQNGRCARSALQALLVFSELTLGSCFLISQAPTQTGHNILGTAGALSGSLKGDACF
jgi:hypothetical protein